MVSVENEFVEHIPCPECGSSDANSLYSDGHTFCFKCHARTHGNNTTTHNHQVSNVQLQGSARRLQSRGISERTCELFKTYKDGEILRHYYFDSTGKVVGAKVRTKDKEFRCEGEVSSLFGMQNFPVTTKIKKANFTKTLVITEGEMDAMSIYEAQPNYYAIVSIPNGAAAAKKAIQKSYEYVNSYEKVILCMDNDEAGHKAAIEAAGVLPPGKAYIGFLSDYKDASEALQAGETEAIRELLSFGHKQYQPDGIVDAKTLLELVTTPSPPSDHDYPFDGLNKLLHGIRYGELVTITAGSGVGKSSILREICADLLSKGERCGFLALEESNRRTALGLMSVAARKSLHLGEQQRSELTEIFDNTIANWNLHLFDGFGSYDPDHIYNRIEYMAAGLDTKVIFLDHLSILLSGLEGDERRMIDTTMTRLRSLVERTGISLFLVCHTTTPPNGQSHEEGGRVQLRSLRGSRSIGQLSDAVIALERNQQSGSERDATTIRVLKNRHSGEVGEACQLKYDLNTCKFNETAATTEFDESSDF